MLLWNIITVEGKNAYLRFCNIPEETQYEEKPTSIVGDVCYSIGLLLKALLARSVHCQADAPLLEELLCEEWSVSAACQIEARKHLLCVL